MQNSHRITSKLLSLKRNKGGGALADAMGSAVGSISQTQHTRLHDSQERLSTMVAKKSAAIEWADFETKWRSEPKDRQAKKLQEIEGQLLKLELLLVCRDCQTLSPCAASRKPAAATYAPAAKPHGDGRHHGGAMGGAV